MQTARHRNGRPARFGSEPALHVAVVVAADGILYAAVEASPAALRNRLGDFAREHAPTKLWPNDSADVLRLLREGEVDRAVDLYFARVGRRWDPEFLHRQILAAPPAAAAERRRRSSPPLPE